ncbi:serine hydrolase domain-containing protein [Lacinutrix sp. Bg11-31]|uniref:serine hydrolase domain-containing protein n=1 Tax=Lacinutrix sp. Bg11-31 TaxID=2057808 RepID=UPI000C31223C|nr:serine hydrolase domain-containing protein [Lacinutrix sp. Bg11-31]AUC83069.1 serine hydrolase [Lacinutrix sp. Bg11-31]
MKFKAILLFFIVTTFSCKPNKEEQIDTFKEITKLVDIYANQTLEKNNINSLAFAIYKDEEIYKNYYGEIDKGANNTPDDNTLYEIASITKVFAGSLAAKAVLENKITLNDDIRKYLIGDYTNLEFEGTPITIKNLLTHTIGLKNKTPKRLKEVTDSVNKGYFENKPFTYTINHLLEELKTVTVNKKPGTVYAYNSVGPELVAYILEQVYQKPYSILLQAFLDELNMKNTYLLDSNFDDNRVVNSYNNGKLAPLNKNPLLGATAGLVTTLPDLITFMKFQLESDNPIVKESVKQLFEDDDDNLVAYLWEGLGVGEEEGFYYSKTGTSSGVQSGLLLCPDSDYGLILIMNSNSDAALNNWENLFYGIENELIKYPKLNSVAFLENTLLHDTDNGIKKLKQQLKDTTNYYTNNDNLNAIAYQLLNNKKTEDALKIFNLQLELFPNHFNSYDSLGEFYFTTKALFNYKKSLEFNPENENAKIFIQKIEEITAK